MFHPPKTDVWDALTPYMDQPVRLLSGIKSPRLMAPPLSRTVQECEAS